MNIGLYIKELRQKKSMTQEELGQHVGVQRAAVQKWESGKTQNLKRTTISKLALLFEVSPATFIDEDSDEKPTQKNAVDIFSYSNIIPLPHTHKIPLIGDIACGVPISAQQNFEDYIDTPDSIQADFCLRCHGDSMINARIYDGDLVFIKAQSSVDNGQIGVVLIDNEATLKRVFHYVDSMVLQSENPAFPPIVITGEKLNDVRIQGRAVAFSSVIF